MEGGSLGPTRDPAFDLIALLAMAYDLEAKAFYVIDREPDELVRV